jgi:ABC-type uncharacterized transport system substrate-binding protein
MAPCSSASRSHRDGWVYEVDGCLARPGGNVTGISNQIGEVQSKGMQLLKEVVPRITRLAVLWNPDNQASAMGWQDQKPLASPLGLTVISVEIRKPADVEPALALGSRRNAPTRLPRISSSCHTTAHH